MKTKITPEKVGELIGSVIKTVLEDPEVNEVAELTNVIFGNWLSEDLIELIDENGKSIDNPVLINTFQPVQVQECYRWN